MKLTSSARTPVPTCRADSASTVLRTAPPSHTPTRPATAFPLPSAAFELRSPWHVRRVDPCSSTSLVSRSSLSIDVDPPLAGSLPPQRLTLSRRRPTLACSCRDGDRGQVEVVRCGKARLKGCEEKAMVRGMKCVSRDFIDVDVSITTVSLVTVRSSVLELSSPTTLPSSRTTRPLAPKKNCNQSASPRIPIPQQQFMNVSLCAVQNERGHYLIHESTVPRESAAWNTIVGYNYRTWRYRDVRTLD